MSHHQHASCIEACNQCSTTCEHCSAACLTDANVQQMTKCIQLDRDCADMCRLAVALMARNSPYAAQVCQLCATICTACADECAKHEHEHCQECAKACRRCAEECSKIAA